MKNQMPLENLPEYLKSLKENGGAGSPLVGMGQILPEKKSYWPQTILAMFMLMTLGIGGMMTYDTVMPQQQFTVIVDMQNPSQTIPEITSNSEIIAVEQNTDSTYAVKVSTRKNKHSFLKWLFGNKDVKEVD